MTITDTDAKAGFSSYCRRGEHAGCKSAKARCTCTCHGRAGQQPPKAKEQIMASVPQLKSVPQAHTMVELVEEEPPPARARGIFANILAVTADMESDVWYRVATWTGKTSANGVVKQLRVERPQIEWVARRHGDGSAVWGRRK